MEPLTVLYDATCPLCVRCRDWLASEPQIIPLRLLPRDHPDVRRVFPTLDTAADELLVVSDSGDVWRGDAAFLTCLFALEGYRSWAHRLARPALRPLVRRAFDLLSGNRHRLAALLRLRLDADLAHEIRLRTPLDRDRCGPDGCDAPSRPSAST
jgi:predicted DCC family thiol-disulfide oxidoreductase YuxK